MPEGPTIPNARTFARNLNILFKLSRLYGLDHAQPSGQFEITWNELQEAVRGAGPSGLLLGASGSQLLLNGVPLESTEAERSVAELLNAAGVASLCFQPAVKRDEFANLVKVFAESGPKAGSLPQRLEQYFGKTGASGIIVNEIRLVDEDASFSKVKMGAQPGGTAGVAPMSEAEMHSLLGLLAQLAEAMQAGNPYELEQAAWQQKLAALPMGSLASLAAQTPSSKLDEAMLLRLAEDLAIRFALDGFQRGEVRADAVRQMLEKIGHQMDPLRKLLKARGDNMAGAGLLVESPADAMDRQFWAAVPESGVHAVLNSEEAWCIPPRNVQQYIEELLGRGETNAAANILRQYASCVRNKDAGVRKRAAIGLSHLAELYGKTASHEVQEALLQIGQQMCAEMDPELQTLLGAAFVRLSQEAAQRRYYRAVQQSLDCLADLQELRPTWVQSLRPRIGVENRLTDFIEEALAAETMPEGLAGVLSRAPEGAAEQLAQRLSRAEKRTDRERTITLAKRVGNACSRHLAETVKSGHPVKAAIAAGLLSRLDPLTTSNLLPDRLRRSGRGFHDSVVRQLAIAGADERGRLLADSLELLDPEVAPLALDEIGMCGDANTAPKLLRLADGDILPDSEDYLRVKAIEALGRLRPRAAVGHLRRFLETRRGFGWAYPEEMRTAAAQALAKIDPDWVRENAARLGLNEKVLALAPLDPAPERDVVRHRRYRRIRLPRNVPAVITSRRGKHSLTISVLSLEGGLLHGDIQLAVGTEATLKIPAGLRSINTRAVVRFARPQQAGFEMVGMRLDDRAKLRRLLVSLGGAEPETMTPQTA